MSSISFARPKPQCATCLRRALGTASRNYRAPVGDAPVRLKAANRQRVPSLTDVCAVICNLKPNVSARDGRRRANGPTPRLPSGREQSLALRPVEALGETALDAVEQFVDLSFV